MSDKLRSVKVTYSDGSQIETSMAANLSDQDIKDYFKVGKEFNIGSGGKDKMVTVKKVEILEDVKEAFASKGAEQIGGTEYPYEELQKKISYADKKVIYRIISVINQSDDKKVTMTRVSKLADDAMERLEMGDGNGLPGISKRSDVPIKDIVNYIQYIVVGDAGDNVDTVKPDGGKVQKLKESEAFDRWKGTMHSKAGGKAYIDVGEKGATAYDKPPTEGRQRTLGHYDFTGDELDIEEKSLKEAYLTNRDIKKYASDGVLKDKYGSIQKYIIQGKAVSKTPNYGELPDNFSEVVRYEYITMGDQTQGYRIVLNVVQAKKFAEKYNLQFVKSKDEWYDLTDRYVTDDGYLLNKGETKPHWPEDDINKESLDEAIEYSVGDTVDTPLGNGKIVKQLSDDEFAVKIGPEGTEEYHLPNHPLKFKSSELQGKIEEKSGKKLKGRLGNKNFSIDLEEDGLDSKETPEGGKFLSGRFDDLDTPEKWVDAFPDRYRGLKRSVALSLAKRDMRASVNEGAFDHPWLNMPVVEDGTVVGKITGFDKSGGESVFYVNNGEWEFTKDQVKKVVHNISDKTMPGSYIVLR